MPGPGEVTQLLHDWRGGDAAALERLIPLVYRRLRLLAQAKLSQERPDHTLQPTALVHEVFVRLVEARELEVSDRVHFFALAARLMREILIDQGRARRSAKRGGGAAGLSLDEAGAPASAGLDPETLFALDEALVALEALAPRQASVVELRFFTGLTHEEIAQVLRISRATVEREWAVARRWLARRLDAAEAAR